MKKYDHLMDFTLQYPNIVIALGMFDGLHIGHQEIIRTAVSKAQEIKGTALVFSFSNHPRSVIDAASAPKRIGNDLLRCCIIENLGVNVFVEVPFTRDFSRTNAEEFIDLLYRCFSPSYIVVGENYTFGRGGAGTPELLLEYRNKYGFEVIVCPPVCVKDLLVSSTRIRSLLEQGDIPLVNEYLGYPFTLIGEVIHGQARGRLLGFPTANISLDEGYSILPNGVYAVIVSHMGACYRGVANIGSNPTFDGCDRRLEVHIFDFSCALYGADITVSFYKKIREEIRFQSVDALIDQIKSDKKAALKVLEETFHLQENISMVI